jgi:DNA-binding NtrC family response regulator
MGDDRGLVPPQAVLVAEDEESIRESLVELFEGCAVTGAADLDAALRALRTRPFDLVVTDIRLGGRRDAGLQIIASSALLSPDAAVLAMTAYPDAATRAATLRLGASCFLAKPVGLERVAEFAARHGVRCPLTTPVLAM